MAFSIRKIFSSIWVHLLLMGVLSVVIYMIFFSSLKGVTNHGEEVKVPELLNRPVQEALTTLQKGGFEIDIDSTYDMKRPSGTVLSQMPDTGSMVKRGRTVFIVINKTEAPMIPMPDLTGVSYRSAEMLLKSNKLRLADTIHKPDIADGAILEQLYNGEEVKAGDMIPQGSSITLVIGDGLGNVEFDVPNVVGMSYPEGIAMLNALGLQFIDIWEGPISDSFTAVIFYQFPKSRNEFGGINKMKEGEMIDIKIRQAPPEPDMSE